MDPLSTELSTEIRAGHLSTYLRTDRAADALTAGMDPPDAHATMEALLDLADLVDYVMDAGPEPALLQGELLPANVREIANMVTRLRWAAHAGAAVIVAMADALAPVDSD